MITYTKDQFALGHTGKIDRQFNQPQVELQADAQYQWDNPSAGPDKHQRFRRPASRGRLLWEKVVKRKTCF